MSFIQSQTLPSFRRAFNPHPTNHHHRITSSTTTTTEIRVCTNRTCRKQGSLTTLTTLSDISPPHVSVSSCGCLGRCGAGPNVVVLPQAAIVGHCGTPTRAAEVMVFVCGGGGGDVRRSLDSAAVRKRADVEFESGNLELAEALFSQAIEAKPIGGTHIAYKGRSAVRLASGNFAGALEDANEALVIAPHYVQAYIAQGDAYQAMDQFEVAEKSYTMALEADPSIRRSKSFKSRVQLLQDKMSSGATP